jgi:methyl-accepting chemotaxis protein
VSDIIGMISRASLDQGKDIAQVNHAIGQMDQITQENAALVEEAAAAAESMRDQVAVLARSVALFRTDETGLDRQRPVDVQAESVPAGPQTLHSVMSRARTVPNRPTRAPGRRQPARVANGAAIAWNEYET